MIKKMFKASAFSLVEMLMALLAASLLMAALAPVMTKKFKENVHINATGISNASNFRIFQYEDCEAKADNTAVCKFKVPQNIHMIDIYLQGAGGGGAGATSGVNETCTVNTHTGNTSANKTICQTTELVKNQYDPASYSSWNEESYTRNIINAQIVPGMQNFKAVLIAQGGGGGGATGRIECHNETHKYLTAAQNGGTPGCVTKYNGGDTYLGGPSAHVGGNSVVNAGQNCTGPACCWLGNNAGITASTALCENTYGTPTEAKYISYSGCKRTSCTFEAANNICRLYTGGGVAAGQWQLPSIAQIQAWADNFTSINHDQGHQGLMICLDGSKKSIGTVNCENNSNACLGSHDNSCHNYNVWTSAAVDTSGRRANGWFGDGVTGIAQWHPANAAFGTRCVSTNTSLYGWKSYSGGGGSSGSVVTLNPTSAKFNELLKNNIGNSIHFYARSIKRGAPAANLSATSSKRGEYSTHASVGLHLHSGNASSIIDVSGIGQGGYGGAIFSQGQEGIANANCASSYMGITKGIDYTCTTGNSGQPGTPSKGGNGGSISYTLADGTTHTCNGTGGNPSIGNQNGSTPSCYGAGGGGAASYSTANGKGGDGGISYAEASYKIIRPGAAGGGGGGGAYLSKKSIIVSPDSEITIIIGMGGKGGVGGSLDAALLNGKDGTDSKILINGKEYIAEGGKGGKSGNDSTLTPAGGLPGNGGTGTPINAVTKGANGTAGTYDNTTKVSYGGRGGNSGSGGIGGCGGLYSGSECSNPASTNASTLSVISDSIVSELLNNFKAPSGQGGGGGGFRGIGDSASFGNGASGLNGYAMIDWRKY